MFDYDRLRLVAVVPLAAAWTAVALLSYLELTQIDTGLHPKHWVYVTLPAPALALVATLAVFASRLGCVRLNAATAKLNTNFTAARTQWLVYVFSTGLVMSLFAQLSSHYSDAELDLLHERRWFSRAPADQGGLDPLVVVHWLLLHTLALASWLVMAATLLVVLRPQ